jgi:hypothetical protein
VVISWEPLINEASQRFGVPADLIMATMRVESGGRRGAVSPKGAAGLMQLMLPTYQEMAGKHALGPDRFDPRNNVMAGTAYLRQNYDQFGDWTTALAAYNAGPGRVGRVNAGTSTMPQETTDYTNNPALKSVLAQYEPNKRADMPPFSGATRNPTGSDLNWWDGGLLNPGTVNWNDGLGILSNAGQTPGQPPRTEPTTDTTQTERLDVSGRINEMLQQLAQPYDAGPRLTPGQYQLAGAGGAVGKLAGVHNRRVGIGELLGALGGGLTGGTELARKAGHDERAQQFGELANITKLQGYQRSEAAAENKIRAARAYADELDRSGDPQKMQLAAALRLDPTNIDEIIKAQAGKIWERSQPATNINLNTAENKGAIALTEGRVKRYEDIRLKGENSNRMLNKLGQLEEVLNEIGTTGPATPTISKLIGWARQAGIPTEQVNDFYKTWTGEGLADPAKVDLATKLIQDFVTSSIKTLGANPTDTDLATLQQANPSITNQAEANRYIIQHSLRPQFEYDRDLWNHVRGLDRQDQTLDTLETKVYDFEQRRMEERRAQEERDRRAAPTQRAVISAGSRRSEGDPPPPGMTPPEPGALWNQKLGAWLKPDPDRPGKWLRLN